MLKDYWCTSILTTGTWPVESSFSLAISLVIAFRWGKEPWSIISKEMNMLFHTHGVYKKEKVGN